MGKKQGVRDDRRAQALALLTEVGCSTEAAVLEICSTLDRASDLLTGLRRTAKPALQRALDRLGEELVLISSALQFQDITSQQLEAVKALVAGLAPGAERGQEVAPGAFDAKATFDRKRAHQAQEQIDSLLRQGKKPLPPKKAAVAGAKPPVGTAGKGQRLNAKAKKGK